MGETHSIATCAMPSPISELKFLGKDPLPSLIPGHTPQSPRDGVSTLDRKKHRTNTEHVDSDQPPGKHRNKSCPTPWTCNIMAGFR